MKYRFHVVALPHTETTDAYLACAYTQKTVKFCKMMMSLGHEVYLYAAEHNDTTCTEHIVCTKAWEPEKYTHLAWHSEAPIFKDMNAKVIEAMKSRLQPRDFICLPGGLPQMPIAQAFPGHICVETGIGYGATFSKFRVFESHTWRSAIMGQETGACQADGNFYDQVINNFFDVSQFPFSEEKEDYILYIGRVNKRKGLQIACDISQRLGKDLVIAGPSGDFQIPDDNPHIDYVGPVGVEARGKLMSRAQAVIVPTLYLGPFEGVAVEALLCGTPVITTDWGAFVEYVENGKNGYRCNVLAEFCRAVEWSEQLAIPQRLEIRQNARARFDMDVIKHEYQRYFDRLSDLWQDGFYTR